VTRPIPDPVDLAAWTAPEGARPGQVDAIALLPGEDLRVLIVHGRGTRHDFHINPVDELFQQLRGDIVVRLREASGDRDVVVRSGEVWLAPADVPHSPQRPVGSVGLVVERVRAPDQAEVFRWYCPACAETLFEVVRSATRPADLAAATAAFEASEAARTCRSCGHVLRLP
jgi:3-hydroxyanthranilate 3,4-dioxygenase